MADTIQSKCCSRCKQIKAISQFSNDKQKKDGLCSHCKKCQLQYHKSHRTECQQYNKQYRQKYRVELLQKKKQYYQKHQAKRLQHDKQYYREHKVERLQYQKQYRQMLKGHLRIVWQHILYRCTNPKDKRYKHYGGRGIKVKFASFEDFYDYIVNDLKTDPRGLTIDRIDNDGHYEKGNIRFVSRAENLRNRKRRRKS